jgi:hypothetical protein
VAVGADGSFFRSRSDRMPVYALLIRRDHPRALPAILHDKFLAVARTASRRNVRVVHARFRIARRQQFVRAAVAIDAGGCVHASMRRFRVEAAIIPGLLIGVALRAGDFLRCGFVGRAFNIGVAIHASEHAAVNRIFERLRIHGQADRLAVHIVSQARIAMAGEAIIGRGFRGLFSAGSEKTTDGNKQGESDPRRKKSPFCSRGHYSHPPVFPNQPIFNRRTRPVANYFLPNVRI